jgi:O-acetyl-ADP-ribose deacetylase (regulator of RNase III)
MCFGFSNGLKVEKMIQSSHSTEWELRITNMITYVYDDLFQSPAKVLVNTVNTVWVMGKGIALQFKKVYPDMFDQYRAFCEQGLLEVGKLWIYKTDNKWVLNFPTKKHWRSKSRLEWIEAGLQKFVDTYDERGITSISFPLLGCGNGELDWETQVRPLMEKYLEPLPIQTYIHLYQADNLLMPEHLNTTEMKQWLHQHASDLPFSEFWDDLVELLNKRQKFIRLTTNAPFTVQYITDHDGENIILIQPKTIPVEQEQLFTLWQTLRSAEYCLLNEFPAGLAQCGIEIASLIDNLDYIRAIKVHTSSEADELALRLQSNGVTKTRSVPQQKVLNL